MTRTEFAAKYRILRAIADDGIRSFTAQHVATQRPVMVHFLDSAAAAQRAEVLDRLGRLDGADRPRVLERFEVDGAPVVVTQVLPSFESLASWLAARTSAPQTFGAPSAVGRSEREIPRVTTHDAPTQIMSAPSAPPPVRTGAEAPAQQKREPGEFTRLFSAPAAEAFAPPPAPATPAPPPPAASPSPAAPAAAAPAPVIPSPAAPAAAARATVIPSPVAPAPAALAPITPPSAPAPPSVAPAEPGEFTRLFRQMNAPPSPRPAPDFAPPPASPMPAQASPPPFAPPLAPPPAPTPLGGDLALPPIAPTPHGAGTATGALEARPLPPRPASPPPAPPRADAQPIPGIVPLDFPPPPVPLHDAPPMGAASSPPFAAPPPLAAPVGEASPAAPSLPPPPSAFTRVIAGPAAAPGAAPAPQAQPGDTAAPAATPAPTAPGATKPLPLVPLLLGINLIVLLAIALVLWLALGR